MNTESNNAVIQTSPLPWPNPTNTDVETPAESDTIVQDTCNTSPGITGVIQEPCNTPVIPVSSGNMAGLQQNDSDITTESAVSKTYRIPGFVIPSMERVINELNKVLPVGAAPITMHSYGVDLLSRHEQLRKAVQEVNGYKNRLEQALQQVANQSALIQSLTSQNEELKVDLQNARDFALEHPYLVPTPPVETIPPPDEAWRTRYEQLQEEFNAALAAHQTDLRAVRPLNEFVSALPAIIDELCKEASRQSSWTPAYYQKYYQELIAPFIIQ